MLGQFASQIARQQREQRPTSTQPHIYKQVEEAVPKQYRKSFREVMRECYYKREQAHLEKNDKVQAEMRKYEHERLFGYVLKIDGKKISTDEALRLMEKGKLTKHEILEWHNPEIYEDVVNSIGERDSLDTFPALDINRGDVLHDPKIRGYVHPSLKE